MTTSIKTIAPGAIHDPQWKMANGPVHSGFRQCQNRDPLRNRRL